MDLQITGHVAIVQGASKGIGRGIAEALAAEGCDLVLAARNEETLQQAADEITKASGRRAIAVAADSASLEDNEKLVACAKAEFGRLDILVCNSGGPAPGGLVDLTPQHWRDAAALLVVSPAHLLKTALPLLEQSPAPRFLVVTSSSTREPVGGLLLSNTYRPGIVGMIKTLANELGPRGIRCHSLAPGRIDTDRLAKVMSMQAQRTGKEVDEVKKTALGLIPAGRFGRPADLGSLAAYLASPRADYLTGGNWLVDGGLIKSL